MLRLITALIFASLALPARARAFDVEIDSETIGQGYQVAGADGTVIDRRRLNQYLGLNVWNLGPKDAFGAPTAKNQFYVTMSLRLDSDFGNYSHLLLGTRGVRDELANNRLDILYAYVGARDLGGLVDVKLGRQIDIDMFEFTSYDGLSVEVKTPYYVAVQAWGGLLVNGALPFDSPVFRPDGTAQSAISTHDHDWKPTVGVALKSFGFRDLDACFSYRRTFSPGQNTTADERSVHATDGTSEEKLGWSARARIADGRILPWVGVRYNLLVGVIDNVQAGVRFRASERHSFSLEYLYSYPTFDGDSIWNLFVRSQFDDARAGYDVNLGALKLYARAFLRFFHDSPNDRLQITDPSKAPSSPLDFGGNIGARLDLPRGFVRADGYADLGYGGSHIGVDVASRLRLFRELVAAEGRLTYAHFSDDLRPIDSGDSFGVQLGARLILGRGMVLHILAEDNINKFFSSQLRLYAVLDLAFLVGGNGFSQALPRGIGPGMGQFTMGGGY